jgi:hypothetical protein
VQPSSAQLTSEQLNKFIEDEIKTDQDAKEVQKQLDCEEVRDPDYTGSALSTAPNTINNEFELVCLHEAVWILNVHSIRQLTDDHVPGQKYSIPGMLGI